MVILSVWSDCLLHPFLSRVHEHVLEVLETGRTTLSACASFYLSFSASHRPFFHLLPSCVSMSVFSTFLSSVGGSP